LCKKMATVNSSLENDIYLQVFFTKLNAHEMFMWREFGTTSWGPFQKYLRTPVLRSRCIKYR